MKLAMPEKDKQYHAQKCVFFNTPPKISHNFQSIRYYVVNLWEFCVFNNCVTCITENLRPVAEYDSSAKIKWIKDVTQEAVSCHLLSA